MIIKDFLEILGFKSQDNILFEKEYKQHQYTIKIDAQKEKIFYRNDDKITVFREPDAQIQLGDKTTSNFSQLENFVVLECVDRLLLKGYQPNDIHLERRYPSGRGASGGKSDICVYGKDEKSLLVIECKTWGAEFEKEKKKMDEHGGQLFAYLANDQNAKFLVLYASCLSTNKQNLQANTQLNIQPNLHQFDYENIIVQIKDREEDLVKTSKQIEEENIKLYREAKNKGELFEVWKESFNKYTHFNGIFDEDANAYSLELKAIKKKNLKSLEDSQGLFNKFAEILRHNNISDNANAFNKILSLFLCKIVDEGKTDEQVLDFQVKENEKYEHIIDRLQALYQKGMKRLGEEMVYFPDSVIADTIKMYPKQVPLEELKDVFRQQKYYTNNDFAFKPVHNKKLFEQNARVLNEVIKLLQNFRFRFTAKQQVLGDFFELMLNHGVKQSEGQFFTPIPIVRFITLSLGFDSIIHRKIQETKEEDNPKILPKILDYACGAGHFLTESVDELKDVLETQKITQQLPELAQIALKDYEKRLFETYADTLSEKYKNELLENYKQAFIQKFKEKLEKYQDNTFWAKDYIFGIEKDYRLARTSQIACYINGDGEANIIFGDGLEEHDQLQLQKNKFDVVVANPPYSVKSFKNYLNVGKAHFDLFGALTETSSEIEALFIERTKQVLAHNGLAGIILPSTILSNTGIYTKVREVLLKYFEIKAITELGSKTFIATGTTTVVLFLKRRNDSFLKDRQYIADDLFNDTQYAINIRYIDAQRFLRMFTDFRNFDIQEYKHFLKKSILEDLANTEMFKEYKNAFDASTDTKQLKTKAFFKNFTKEKQEIELKKRFYFYCKDKEQEKFLYFMLCLGDGNFVLDDFAEYYRPQQTLVIKTGKETDEQKEYLGYEFQGKKGQEGIKIANAGSKLFDEKNHENPEKANFYVRKAMHNIPILEIDKAQENNISIYNTFDLIDFERVDFEKQININASKKITFTSVYDMFALDSLVSFQSGLWIGETAPLQTIKVIRNTNFKLNNGKLDYTDIAKIEVETKQLNERQLKYGDIIVEKSGGSDTQAIGRVVLFDKKDGEIYSYSNFCSRIRVNDEKIVHPVYMWAMLNDFYRKGGTISLQNGVRLLNIEMSSYKRIKIPVPPMPIQEQIIQEIEEIENIEKAGLQRITQLNKEIETTIKGITAKNVKLIEVADLQKGTSITKEKTTLGSVPVVAGGQQPAYYHNEYNREANIITISASGAYAGFINFWNERIFASDCTTVCSLDEEKMATRLLFHILKGKQQYFYDLQKGAAQPHVYAKDFQNLEIPLPSLLDQQNLLENIAQKEEEIDTLKRSLATIFVDKENVLKKYL